MGVSELTNEPQPVPVSADSAGTLDAMMLDMRRTFDDMVVEHSTPERAEAIMNNAFYQTVASSFSGTQEYMAMEKLYALHADEAFDLIFHYGDYIYEYAQVRPDGPKMHRARPMPRRSTR